MYLKSTLILAVLLLSACGTEKTVPNLNGEKLLEQKCASCHDLHMPPIISDDELAPPMMAIGFHMPNFMEPKDESQRVPMAIEFVVDFIRNPLLENSKCDKESIQRYGLMPSQKERVTKDEARAIAQYMFRHYTQENLSKKQKLEAKFNALPAGQKIALKYRCMGCHKIDKKTVGPSFKDIAKKYIKNQNEMIGSIENGSKLKWESSKGAVMPPFKQISDEDLKILIEWIIQL
ncbi:MAG: c-type cytochrome [Campylobacterota bacterium]|nr:c-type cytochrome [Campylobacterota bacterium]